MNLASVIICDSATVREGLLHILGGGISMIWRPEAPFELGVVLAFSVQVMPDDNDFLEAPNFVLRLDDDADGSVLMELGGVLPLPRPSGRITYVPVVLDVSTMMVPHYGEFTVRLKIDGLPEVATPLTAVDSKPDVSATASTTP
ncbi:DUF6941 family protein [Clavibacter nebraskensis]|uniref:DUF6941 family protein n=1 Tax=Clavibacter nebraskensis TaxID=31963 RepID=UPI00200C4450|nr:hypothetical protein [Clavibacter nebraskensis]UQB14600.1 hypothetical protein LIX20_001222 [Clavibacter nebraskensis]UQB17432.1 hypothetical protein LIX22_001221 [Clavibacter nebraskensis]